MMNDPADVTAAPPTDVTPQVAPPYRWWHVWPLAMLLLGYALPFAAVFFLVLPRFVLIYKQAGMELPGETRLLLAAGRWFVDGYGWVVVALFSLTVPFIYGSLAHPAPDRRRRAFRRLRLALSLLVGIAIALIGYALVSPYIHFVDALTNPTH